MLKKLFVLFIIFTIVLSFSLLCVINAFAHDSVLQVTYDVCDPEENRDGKDEIWYVLVGDDGDADNYEDECRHISHEETTIKYYFEEIRSISSVWNSGATESDVNQIKIAYANSMKKWNNVYFYSDNFDGTITKNKIINVVEGTEDDHNLSIYLVGGWRILP